MSKEFSKLKNMNFRFGRIIRETIISMKKFRKSKYGPIKEKRWMWKWNKEKRRKHQKIKIRFISLWINFKKTTTKKRFWSWFNWFFEKENNGIRNLKYLVKMCKLKSSKQGRRFLYYYIRFGRTIKTHG